jgi:serine/threonine protein phosphatase PrpC
MTRSIGDRHAARTCICTPEITKLAVLPGEYVRFILASDGLWDVMSSDRAVHAVRNMTDTTRAADYLVKKALKIRNHEGMRVDDITCVVIDINPHFNPVIASSCSNGNCSIS